jgi:hypothetical protein
MDIRGKPSAAVSSLRSRRPLARRPVLADQRTPPSVRPAALTAPNLSPSRAGGVRRAPGGTRPGLAGTTTSDTAFAAVATTGIPHTAASTTPSVVPRTGWAARSVECRSISARRLARRARTTRPAGVVGGEQDARPPDPVGQSQQAGQHAVHPCGAGPPEETSGQVARMRGGSPAPFVHPVDLHSPSAQAADDTEPAMVHDVRIELEDDGWRAGVDRVCACAH